MLYVHINVQINTNLIATVCKNFAPLLCAVIVIKFTNTLCAYQSIFKIIVSCSCLLIQAHSG